jgi:hypothetical protein
MRVKKEYIPVKTQCCFCNKGKSGNFYYLGYDQYGCTRCLKNDHQAQSYADMLDRVESNGTISK